MKIIHFVFSKFIQSYRVLWSVFCIFFVFSSFAVEDLDFNYGFISDNAKIISSRDYNKIESVIFKLKKETTAEIAVVTVNSLQGKSVEDTAVEIGRKYGVGNKDANNGVVILVAPNERKMRIELGIGLEDKITNQQAEKIVKEDMFPYFSKGEYSEGILNGVTETAKLVAQCYGKNLFNTIDRKISLDKETAKLFVIIFFLWLFKGKGILQILLILILCWLITLYTERSIPNKKGKDGNFGGGGGFSGGHGASGSS